uniref:ADP-ribosylhydrolase ARH3 n=1 Tax=Trepomonas sp. PC1 TaxID=1076344 RepID=A0A146KBR3_9EUKA|eukprot:JAP92819.1 ADP-ribosylglycohydrolase [Trepomonas sp. PC1]
MKNQEMISCSYLTDNKDLMKSALSLKIQLEKSNYSQLSTLQRRQLGAFMGTIVGDALGAPFEFMEFTKSKMLPGKVYSFPETKKQYQQTFQSEQVVDCCPKTCQNFNLGFGALAGMWTDDSCQMLCLAEVLAFYKTVNGCQLHWAIDDWWKHGFCTAHSSDLLKMQQKLSGGEVGSFGRGMTTKQSMHWFYDQNLQREDELQSCYTESGDDKTDGNGALMRNGVTFLIKDLDGAIKAAEQQAKTTHKGTAQTLCCMLHTFVGWSYVNQQNLTADFVDLEVFKQLLANDEIPEVFQNVLDSEGKYNWKSPDWDLSQENARGCVGGYAVDCIALALHYLYHSKRLEDLATRGGDADTNAAVFGCLFGAKFGIEGFRENWLRAVLRFDEFGLVCARFLALSGK